MCTVSFDESSGWLYSVKIMTFFAVNPNIFDTSETLGEKKLPSAVTGWGDPNATAFRIRIRSLEIEVFIACTIPFNPFVDSSFLLTAVTAAAANGGS